ncbi:MAG: FAD-binding and (Fe-S)-binding domain-containing protein [Cytophagales bacterium]
MNFQKSSSKNRSLITNFKRIHPKLEIKDSEIDLMVYARDAGFYEITPLCVVFAKSESDVIDVIQFCSQHLIPLFFRAGATSLSGQTVGHGIAIDISRGFKKIEFKNDQLVKIQPGLTGGFVNHYLSKHKRKIGPDPSSIQAAMIGGIVANNASGMCCGVKKNSYHSIKYISWVMPNGNSYSTEKTSDYSLFETNENQLCKEIVSIRNEINSDSTINSLIRKKYQIKNTMGYSMNAFIDYEHPMDIFAHLLVGSEGTLAFISDVTMITFEDMPFKATSLLIFENITKACEIIPLLIDLGAEAVELMDANSLKSVQHLPEIKQYINHEISNHAALLCEFQSDIENELTNKIQFVVEKLLASNSVFNQSISFSTEQYIQKNLWKIRKGLFPSVGAMRKSGTTVVLEDVAFPIEHLATGIKELQSLFLKFNFKDAIIFGHAKDGNLHFVITPDFNQKNQISNYATFMDELVLMVTGLNGSLKAEHGTGRNMAPFVELEWGKEIYGMMKRLKQSVDPNNLFNPGVIINNDPNIHLKNLKFSPAIEPLIDKCIECGFCEPSCPSKNLTLSPRKRIQLRRSLGLSPKILPQNLQYQLTDTCAVDGLCAVDCPVEINTGEMVKKIRNENNSTVSNLLAKGVSRNLFLYEFVIKMGLRISPKQMLKTSLRTIPKNFNKNPKTHRSSEETNPDLIFFSTCAPRLMGTQSTHDSFYVKSLCDLAGLKVKFINPSGQCCGQAFSSKGFFESGMEVASKLARLIEKTPNAHSIPIIFDTSSCTQHFNDVAKQHHLNLIDSVDFIHDLLLPKLKPTIIKKNSVFHHPVCSLQKLNNAEKAKHILNSIFEKVVIPNEQTCCGMAGDRGFKFPELTHSATKQEVSQISKHEQASFFCSSSPSCNINLSFQTGKDFVSLLKVFHDAIIEPSKK